MTRSTSSEAAYAAGVLPFVFVFLFFSTSRVRLSGILKLFTLRTCSETLNLSSRKTFTLKANSKRMKEQNVFEGRM